GNAFASAPIARTPSYVISGVPASIQSAPAFTAASAIRSASSIVSISTATCTIGGVIFNFCMDPPRSQISSPSFPEPSSISCLTTRRMESTKEHERTRRKTREIAAKKHKRTQKEIHKGTQQNTKENRGIYPQIYTD